MSEPWFERWGLIGYRPLNLKGGVLIIIMVLLFFSFAVLSLLSHDPVLSAVFAVFAVAAAIVGHAFIFTRMK
jgi:hypothetical protein